MSKDKMTPSSTRIAAVAICVLISSCASTQSTAQWAANAWLAPGRNGEPELIGIYESRRDCEAAVEGWLSRQVVGNPIDGACLPVDHH